MSQRLKGSAMGHENPLDCDRLQVLDPAAEVEFHTATVSKLHMVPDGVRVV